MPVLIQMRLLTISIWSSLMLRNIWTINVMEQDTPCPYWHIYLNLRVVYVGMYFSDLNTWVHHGYMPSI